MRDSTEVRPRNHREEAAQDIDLRGKTALVTGIKAYALDIANADRMWDVSEKLVGERFALNP